MKWRALPGDFLPWQTVYTFIFATGAHVGTWFNIHDHVCKWTRIEQERDPCTSEAIIDSQYYRRLV
ncbi:MAG: hypothetical protein V7K42_25595 [Nostoc sp.]